MPIVPVLPALDYADFALQAAQLFLACAVVVLAGQRVAAYLRPRWPAAPPRPAAALAGRERGPDLLSPWAGDGRQSPSSALARADQANELHALALRQIDSAEYLLGRLHGELERAMFHPLRRGHPRDQRASGAALPAGHVAVIALTPAAAVPALAARRDRSSRARNGDGRDEPGQRLAAAASPALDLSSSA